MPKQSLNQLQPKQSDSITYLSHCLSQRAHGSKKCAQGTRLLLRPVRLSSAESTSFHSVSRTPRLQSCAFCVFPGTSAAYFADGARWLMAHCLRYPFSAYSSYSLGSFPNPLSSLLRWIPPLSPWPSQNCSVIFKDGFC